MFGSPRPTTTFLMVSTRQLRRLLEKALHTDSQLEAFCIDYFPKVHRQFSSGMDRTQKLNLLLLVVPRAALLDSLRSYVSEVVESELSTSEPSLLIEVSEHIARGKHWGVGSLGVCIALVAVFGVRTELQREQAGTAGGTTTTLIGSKEAASADGRDPAPWLTSDPSGALVVDATTGRELGQTPWTPESLALPKSLPASGLRVCLRQAGFVPVLVSLGPNAGPDQPRHVPLQTKSQAALQHSLGQEECNAPIPIIP